MRFWYLSERNGWYFLRLHFQISIILLYNTDFLKEDFKRPFSITLTFHSYLYAWEKVSENQFVCV
jgi:hypothetical protein